MFAAANLLVASLVLQVPEGGAAWMYLLLACTACAGAVAYSARTRRSSSH